MSYILHIDLDTFFVSCERLMNPDLVGKPVICGRDTARGVVSTASYEVRKFGVHSGMSIALAKKMCPQAIIVFSEHSVYQDFAKKVYDIVAQRSPLFQQMSIDEYYIDLAGMDKYFNIREWSHNLRMEIIEKTGLPISYGLSINRTVAKIASGMAKPMGELFIDKDEVQNFLDPLPVEKIPGVGAVLLSKLRANGIFTVKDFRMYPKSLIIRDFGNSSYNLWQKANGIDNSKVIPYTEPKSISRETTFEKDIDDHEKLTRIILQMTDSLAFELRNMNKLCGGVCIKIKFPNFQTKEKQSSLSPTDYTLTLKKLAVDLFNVLHENTPIRLIGVRLNISQKATSMEDNLFDKDSKQRKLLRIMDGIKKCFGERVIIF